jgi:hypothetical protein
MSTTLEPGAQPVEVLKGREVLEHMGGRRFLLCLGSGVITSLLTWVGKIDGSIYATVILGTIGVYVAGNTYQKTRDSGDHAR